MKKAIILAMAVSLFILGACTGGTKDVPAATEAPTEASSNTPAKAYTVEIIMIDVSGHSIPGILTVPVSATADEKFPAIVMLHGTGSDKNEAGNGYSDIAPLLAEVGIASLRIDFMGSGESTADYAQYSFTTAVADANTAFDFLGTHASIDGERIGIIGWSQGGTDALLAAASNEGFKSVITWAGATDLSGMVTEEMRAEALATGSAVMEFEWRESLNLGQQWIDEVDATNVLAEIAKIKAPILAIAGSVDTVVLPKVADSIIEASQNADSRTHVIQGADHTYNLFTEDRTAYEELCETTINWFKETL